MKALPDKLRPDLGDAIRDAAAATLGPHGSLDGADETGTFQPHVLDELSSRGFQADPLVRFETAIRVHEFDIIWRKDGQRGAIELKLKSRQRNHPADDSRLFFWYDLKWLELGREAGHIDFGTSVLLTDLRQLYEETGRGDERHDYYRIGHLNSHRCRADEPDHFFDLRYAPKTQFLKEMYPLRIEGCYDFRDKWSVVADDTYLLMVPV